MIKVSRQDLEFKVSTCPPPPIFYQLRPIVIEASCFEYQSQKEGFYLSHIAPKQDVSVESLISFLYSFERICVNRMAMDKSHMILVELAIHLGMKIPKIILSRSGESKHYTSAVVTNVGYSTVELVAKRGGKIVKIFNVPPELVREAIISNQKKSNVQHRDIPCPNQLSFFD
ncbi:hypothetical protein [Vibrio penaeicida]|uniref:hypothetical protein n=1 Tax=Vibrio penaeicida TaxID=104609 RepID=UPI001CC74C81|nr:hypothetical protein [Vibrio penaeicida]